MIASQCVPFVLHESITLNILQSRLHGLDHWFRVWQNAQLLTGREHSADLEVVALFALFHDSMRRTEGVDVGHGQRGYNLWERICHISDLDRWLTRRQNELLLEACVEHSSGYTTTEPTIAVCWDADRLDIHRKGVWPNPTYLSTQTAIDLTIHRLPRKR